MVGQHGDGHQAKQQMENVCGLHKPEQGMPKGLVSTLKH